VRLKFSDLVKIVAMVEHHGQSKKLVGRTNAINASVRVPADAAVAVKKLVAAHPVMSSSLLGRRVLFGRKKTPTAGAVQRDAAIQPSGGSVATGNDYCCGFGPGG
jgi:hypothetical protein